jgi:hypothetical protein
MRAFSKSGLTSGEGTSEMPSTLVMRSPGVMPAEDAGDPVWTGDYCHGRSYFRSRCKRRDNTFEDAVYTQSLLLARSKVIKVKIDSNAEIYGLILIPFLHHLVAAPSFGVTRQYMPSFKFPSGGALVSSVLSEVRGDDSIGDAQSCTWAKP